MSVTVTASFKLKADRIPELDSLFDKNKQIVNELLSTCVEKQITGLSSLHKAKYQELREKYPELHSMYIPDAMRQALGIFKNFRKRKRRGEAKGDRPIFKRDSILLHRRLFRLDMENWKVIIVIGKGKRMEADLYHAPYHEKFRRMIQREAYIIKNEKGYFLNVSFIAEVSKRENGKAIAIDINEDNITFGDKDNIDQKGTKEKAIRTGYYLKRRRIQKAFQLGDYARFRTPYPKKAQELLKKYRKRQTRRILALYHFMASGIIREATKREACTIVMEDLRYIEKGWRREKNLKDPKRKLPKALRGRLNRWSFRKLQNIIEYKAKLAGLNVVYVDPRWTSSLCPACGEKLIPNGGRQMRCPKCGLEEDRDRIAVKNLLQKLKDVGSFPAHAGDLSTPNASMKPERAKENPSKQKEGMKQAKMHTKRGERYSRGI
jgi:putative transposase